MRITYFLTIAALAVSSCKTPEATAETCKLQIDEKDGIAEFPLGMQRELFLKQYSREFTNPAASAEETRYYELDDLYVNKEETVAVNFDYDDHIWMVLVRRKDLCLGPTPLVGSDLRQVHETLRGNWQGERAVFNDAQSSGRMRLENDILRVVLIYDDWIIQSVAISLKNARIDPFEKP